MDVKIFFSSANKKVYRLVKEFYPFHVLLKDSINFSPHYISHESALYNENNGVKIDHCISNGKYCASPRYDLGVENGKDILLEDIRQKCLFNLSYNSTDKDESYMFMKYLISYYDNCLTTLPPTFNYKCAYERLEEIGYDKTKIENCITKSFNVDKQNDLILNNDNSLLEEDYEAKTKWNVKMFPTVMVNNRTILGAPSGENLLEAICAGFITKPLPCVVFFYPSQLADTSKGDLSFGFIVFIIFLIILLNFGLIYVCKRYIIKRLHERVDNIDINGRINNVVSSYLALRDHK